MNQLDIYEKLVALVDKKIAITIHQESVLLCNQLRNGQNIINSDTIINDIEQLNDYIQGLFQNGFSESELILEEQIKYNKHSLAGVLFCRRINKQLNKLLSEYI